METELHKINFKKHVITTLASDFRSICDSFFTGLRIKHFSYVRYSIEKNRKVEAILTTDPLFSTKIFYPERFYEHAFCGNFDDYSDGLYLWDFLRHTAVYQAIAQNLGCEYGVSIIKKQRNACEFFCFGAEANSPFINQFILSNIDLFEAFILDFKETGHDLITQAENNKIVLPESAGDQIILPYQDYVRALQAESCCMNNKGASGNRILDFDTVKNLNKSYGMQNLDELFNDDLRTLKSALSSRELQCARYLKVGLSAKQIARGMNISPRTVEKHIANLRQKTNSRTTLQLVIRLMSTTLF